MMVEKINEVSRINLASRKSLNITINAGKNPFRTNIRSNVTFYLTCLMKIKIFIFRNNKKASQGQTGRTVELEILQ